MSLEGARLGSTDDAARCAEIVSNWIHGTKWMPRLYSESNLLAMIEEAIPFRELWVVGDPVLGYISFNRKVSQIVALYTERPGNGFGKILLDKVKEGKEWIQLWSHSANEAAHRFYFREGFQLVGYKEAGDDGIPEIQLIWRRGY
ncbi:MAG: GNAT family N-acetyltransferase [Acidiferrobacteraceae bacterium]|nr:GNAT family N-acetyltransferase [Acidiferrobacteraceae bacterium]|tara:strand:+ start:1446 stop:1880 length:435 start_codon:yes stop_codon:yes gene_type:complete